MSKKTTKGRKKLWALIFWPSSKTHESLSDVIPLSKIPKCSSRHVGGTVEIPWKDKNGKISKCKAIILLIDSDHFLLENTVVDVKGNIVEKGSKALTTAAQLEKRKLALENKLTKVYSSEASTVLQQQIIANKRFCMDTQSGEGSSSQVFGPHHTNEENESDNVDSEEESASTSEPAESQLASSLIPAIKAFMPQVTHANIVFLESLLTAAKAVYESETKTAYKSPTQMLVVDGWKEAGTNKVPWYDGARCFIDPYMKDQIEKSSIDIDLITGSEVKNWQYLVRQVLIEIYGKQIGNYCAKGRKGSKPGIDQTISTTLFIYAGKFSGQSVTREEFRKFVNSVCWNHSSKDDKNGQSGKENSQTKAKGKEKPKESMLKNQEVPVKASVSVPPERAPLAIHNDDSGLLPNNFMEQDCPEFMDLSMNPSALGPIPIDVNYSVSMPTSSMPPPFSMQQYMI